MEQKKLILADKLVGVVINQNEKTLLIRKAFTTTVDNKEVIGLSDKAVFVDVELIDKTISRIIDFNGDESIEPVNMTDSVEFIREFLDV